MMAHRSNPSADPVRLAYAAAHVVRKAVAPPDAAIVDQIDWPSTLEHRRYLWSLGFGVAEAMDTAQRSLLGWEAAAQLIEQTLVAAKDAAAQGIWSEVIAGAGTDGLSATDPSLDEIVEEYVRQGEFIQSRGGTVMLLATPFLPERSAPEEDYVRVYTEVAKRLEPPLFVHWLGEMFAANLAGYFPGRSFERIMERNSDKIRGVKLSLLDEARELDLRWKLKERSQVVLTGDDFNYCDLIYGDGRRSGGEGIEIRGRRFPIGDFSHALLGIFDAIAPVAAEALGRLAAGEGEEYLRLMGATEPLARHIFSPPTEHYKAGVVFLAYLNGRQESCAMLGDAHLLRSKAHYERVYELGCECGVIEDPRAAEVRLRRALEWLPES